MDQPHIAKLRWNEVLEDNRAFFALDDPLQVTLRKDELVWVPSDSENESYDEEGDEGDSDEEFRQQVMMAGRVGGGGDDSGGEEEEEEVLLPGETSTPMEPVRIPPKQDIL